MIYTKKGDKGNTSLFNGESRSKSDPIFDVLGTLDELNSLFGILVTSIKFSKEAKDILFEFQGDLFEVGSIIACSNDKKIRSYKWLKEKTKKIEHYIDDLEEKLPKLIKFIIPGGSLEASRIHYTRAVCRRLERKLVSHFERNPSDEYIYIVSFINRMSDFLFVLARYINQEHGKNDELWQS